MFPVCDPSKYCFRVFERPEYNTQYVRLTSWCQGSLLFNFSLLSQSSWDIVVNSLVMIIHSNRKHLFGERLANNILVEVVIDLEEKQEEYPMNFHHPEDTLR